MFNFNCNKCTRVMCFFCKLTILINLSVFNPIVCGCFYMCRVIMASTVTVISKMLSNRDEKGVRKLVKDWPVICSSQVTVGGGRKTKLIGTLLHISKARKVLVTAGKEKKIKKELAYYRLMFIRLAVEIVLYLC